MPIYEYLCGACETKQEALQKMSDAPLTLCPLCGKESMVKLVSAAGFQLKGSGWYVTDFKNGNQPKPKTDSKTDTAASPAPALESTDTAAQKRAGLEPAPTTATTPAAASAPPATVPAAAPSTAAN